MNSSILSRLLLASLSLSLGAASLCAQTRVKDVAVVQGVRDNQLIGVGIVSGLAGQGDSDPISTQQQVSNFLHRFGINITPQNIKAKNSAVVSVTGLIHSGTRNGAKFDVVVSSMSDAKSLQGGTLLNTILFGADGKAYAQAAGPLSIGGFFASGQGGGASSSFAKNHPTVGEIPDGAICEREIPTDYFSNGVLEISLRDADFTSAVRMANAINEQIAPIADAISSSTVRVYVPKESQPEEKQLEFIARVENVLFRPDLAARIIMNEKTGTIVFNSKIKIDSVAVAHGNLTVSIVNSLNVSQPNSGTGNTTIVPGAVAQAQVPVTSGGNQVYYDPTTGGQVLVPVGQQPPTGYQVLMGSASTPAAATATPASAAPTGPGGYAPTNVAGSPAPGFANTGSNGGGGALLGSSPGTAITGATSINVQEEQKNLVVFNDLPTAQDVAAALNALGVTPRDMMAIFQEMKEAGALQAELVVH